MLRIPFPYALRISKYWPQTYDDYGKLDKVLAVFYEALRMFRACYGSLVHLSILLIEMYSCWTYDDSGG